MHKVIVNTTPIIALCCIDKLHLLKEMYGSVLIPEAVYREISEKPNSLAKLELDKSLDWVNVRKIQNETAKMSFKAQLHDGEVEVMILAKEESATLLILDDKNAKKHAKFLKFNVTGTLGVLLKAKKDGRINAIKPMLNKLIANGIYIDEITRNYCLKEAGEYPS